MSGKSPQRCFVGLAGPIHTAPCTIFLLADTLFIVVGDHGEAFGEYGQSDHNLILWEEGLSKIGVF